MSVSTVTVKLNPHPNGVDTTNRHLILFGLATIAASPLTYVAGGLLVSWLSLAPLNSSLAGPIWGVFQSQSGSGYFYQLSANNKLQIMTVDATATGTEYPLLEFTNGAVIPAAVSADVIQFRAEFNKAI